MAAHLAPLWAALAPAARVISGAARASSTGPAAAAAACDALLRAHVRTPYETATVAGQYTIAMRPPFANAPPLILMAGYAAGTAFYLPVLDALARTHHVFAVDWLGTGASSRPPFPRAAALSIAECESFFGDALDAWVDGVGVRAPLTLVGHSLGGYLVSAYALAHPARVGHLVLLSPAGLTHPPRGLFGGGSGAPPHWGVRAVVRAWDAGVTPQGIVRSLGPLGRSWTESLARTRFAEATRRAGIDTAAFVRYFAAITAGAGSGEHALSVLLSTGGFGRAPLLPRLLRAASEGGGSSGGGSSGGGVRRALPAKVSVIFGESDWIPSAPGAALAMGLRAAGVDAAFATVPHAGHLLMLDNPAALVRTLAPRIAAP